jgi:hypothetical protein
LEGLVIAAGVEGELAEEFAVLGVDDAAVAVGDEGQDAFAGVFAAQADVTQLAVVAQRDDPGGVGLVAADPVVDRDRGFGGSGLGARDSAPSKAEISTSVAGRQWNQASAT